MARSIAVSHRCGPRWTCMMRFALVTCFLVGCAAGPRMASSAMPSAASPTLSAVPFERSVFARDPNGQLSEDALQKILGSPIELDLPSRVGVLPIITETDWRGPSPDFQSVPAGMGSLVHGLRKDAAFSLFIEMMPIPSGSHNKKTQHETTTHKHHRNNVLYR